MGCGAKDYPGPTPGYWQSFSNLAEQNGMGYDEIETKTGNLFPTLNGQSEPLYSEFVNSE